MVADDWERGYHLTFKTQCSACKGTGHDVMQSSEQPTEQADAVMESDEESGPTHSCPLCGDAGWPDGTECREVAKARAAGKL